MQDKELRKLNKTELLWIIRDQEAEIEKLKAYIRKIRGTQEKTTVHTEKEQPNDKS